MPDGSQWDVPVRAIAEDWAQYLLQEGDYVTLEQAMAYVETVFSYEEDGDEEIFDWAANNMDWADVQDLAVQTSGHDVPDYQDGWVNGPKEVVP